MRIRTKTTGPSRLPRARVTLPLLGLLVLGFAARPFYDRSAHPTEATMLGMAETRGLIPIMAHPEKGTEVYQWDPDIADIDATDLGKVTDPRALYQGQRYVLVKHPNPHRPGLLIDIRKGEMRYWIRKP